MKRWDKFFQKDKGWFDNKCWNWGTIDKKEDFFLGTNCNLCVQETQGDELKMGMFEKMV